MENKVVKQALDKAIYNGWDKDNNADLIGHTLHRPYELIFNNEFAQALWGKEARPYLQLTKHDKQGIVSPPAWQFHLQQMVISPDPIKYLGEHIND